MAGEFFLELKGPELKGESVDTLHPDTIECSSMSFSVHNASTIGTGTTGHGSGRGTPGDISLTFSASKASPELWKMCVMGQHFEEATIYCVKSAGEEAIEWQKLAMKKVFITSYQQSGSAGSGMAPMESMTLAYAELEVTYKPQKSKEGTAEADVVQGYNFEERKKV